MFPHAKVSKVKHDCTPGKQTVKNGKFYLKGLKDSVGDAAG